MASSSPGWTEPDASAAASSTPEGLLPGLPRLPGYHWLSLEVAPGEVAELADARGVLSTPPELAGKLETSVPQREAIADVDTPAPRRPHLSR